MFTPTTQGTRRPHGTQRDHIGPAGGFAQGGFTLIEVVVSLAILAVGMVGLSVVSPLAVQGVGASGSVTKAVGLCQQKLGDITVLGYDDPLLEAGAAHADTLNPIGGTYHRTWVVTEDTPIAGCKLIEVTVSWRGAREQRVSLSTVISQAGRLSGGGRG